MPDDFSADITTTGSILIDGSANGEIELVGDQDWFEVLLVEDQRYRVEITGLYSGGGDTLADPFLRGVYDQTGTFVPFVIDDDETASERNTVLEFVAGASGIHFLAASGYNQSVGTYTISITDLGPDDDYSADVFTTGTAFPGSSSFGTFEFAGDQDWFKIYLYGGIRYQFQLFGDGTGAWADASNLILGELHDENGDPIPASGETAGENSGFVASPVQSFFEYVAPADGYYFINADTFQGSTGQYQLDVTDLGYIDDHPADDTTSATVAINGSVMAEIEAHGDDDWISVFLLAGNVYDITVSGDGTGLGTLPTPNITGIYDGLSTMVPYSFAGDGLNGSATLRYVAPGTGSYFISVGSFNDDIGTYTVSVTNPFPVDDHGDNATTESHLATGGSQMGLIGDPADVDVFHMSLTAGLIYQIDMIGTELVSPLDTFIDGIYSYPSYFDYEFPNNLIAGTADDNSGLDANSRVIFTAPFTGDFFLSASGAGGDTGAYDVILSVLGLAADDFGDDINTLGTLTVGGSVFGANEIESDQDWFAMTLQAGQVYRLTAADDLTNRGDFSAMSLRIFDQLGVEVSDGIISMSGLIGSELEFAPDTSGTYYAVVGDDSLVNGTGHYALSLQDLGSVDDYTDDITTTGNFFYNGTDHTHVFGEVETPGDVDWFAISLTEGHRYAINLKGQETGVGTLEDPLLAGVYDSAGLLLDTGDNDSGEGLNSFDIFTASYTGTHYLAASAVLSEGLNTGTYVMQVDDLGPLPPLRQDVLNEGTTLDFEVTFDDFGFDRSLVHDWEITSLSFLGDATFTVDYFLSGTEAENLDVSISVFDDPFVEDDETAIVKVVGYIDWIAPVTDGSGSLFLNVDEVPVFGRIERAFVDEEFLFTLNSAPEGAPTPITDYTFDGPGVIGNVLTNFLDGSGESFSVIPTNFDFSGTFVGSISASGDITVTNSTLAPEAQTALDFTVVDSRGAVTEATQTIVIAAEGDDFLPGPTATVFGSLTEGLPGTGRIEEPGDRDRFEVALSAGTIYSLSATSGGSLDPLSNPEIIGLFDDLNNLVSGTSDDDGGQGNDALVPQFTVPQSGVYQVEIASSGDLGTGGYEVQIDAIAIEDDFLPGSFAQGFGSIEAGQSQTGLLEIPADRDRFDVVLTAGQVYSISVEGLATGGGTLANPDLIGIFDGQGLLVAGSSDTDNGTGLNALLTGFEVAVGGIYQIEVGNLLEDAGGSYTLSVIDEGPVDDFLPGATATSLGSVPVDGSATGVINFDGDRDRFEVDLTAGQVYAINLSGISSEGGSLLDPEIVGLFGPLGDLLDGTSDNNDGTGLDASLPEVFINETGTYQIEVASHTDIGTGGYTLSVDEIGTADDFLPGDFSDVLGSIAVGQSQTGALEIPSDRDRFGVELQAGQFYTISVEGTATGGGTLANPDLIGVFDGQGLLVAGSSDADSGTGMNALLNRFEVSVDGTYEIEVGNLLEDIGGSYTLSVTGEGLVDDFLPGATATSLGSVPVDGSATGVINFDGDRDRFEVDLTAGEIYAINLSGISSEGGTLGDPEIIGLFDPLGDLVDGTSDNNSGDGTDAALSEIIINESGTYQIEVASHTDTGTGGYTLSVDQIGTVDDFLPGDFASVFGTVTVDGTAGGTLEVAGDRDRFEVTLQAGVEYGIGVEGLDTNGVSLANPELIGLFTQSGALIAGTSDDDSGVGANALVSGLTVDADGTYIIEVGSSGDLGTGDYLVHVDFEAYLDDFLPGVAGDFGDVTVGGTATGEIDSEADTDRFRVTLEGGTTYQINLRGADTNNGTLTDPTLIGVFDAQGNGPLGQSADDDGGQGLDSLSTFTPATSGTYFIEAAGFDDATGSYALSIDELGLVDDFAADVSTVGLIVPGDTASGNIDFPDDADWFEANLTAGRIYQIDLTSGEGDAPLSDPSFLGIYDNQGNLIPSTFNDDGGEGSNSRLTFVPEASGTFYFSAGGFLEDTGRYQLALSDLGGSVDEPGFNIDLNFMADERYRPAFEAAVAKWESVITGDLPFATVSGIGFVDDILIDVTIPDIPLNFPGVEGEVAYISRVEEQRDGDTAAGALPSYSSIIVNQSLADLAFHNLDELAANAIGRALGFGSLWQEFGLTVESQPGVLTYVGSNALREFAELSGSPNGTLLLDDGSTGGFPGAYWRETLLTSELMTPFTGYRPASGQPRPDNKIDNPLSELTIGAMEDLGYQVNYDAADPFTYNPQALALAASAPAPTAASPAAAVTAPQEEHGFALSDDGAQPNGPTYTYFRANAFSEDPLSVPLTDQNTELLSASGESAELLIGVTGQIFLLTLTGAFAKTNPTAVSQLSGEVSAVEVFNLVGDLVLRLDHSQKPLQVATLLADWPAYPFADNNIVLVADLPGTNARINPDVDAPAAHIVTEAGEDYVLGGAAAELIDGGAADDILHGAAGNDTLIGGPGMDFLHGGDGNDIARYSGNQTAYTLTLSPDDMLLTDRRADGDGMDRLAEVEQLQFETNLFGNSFNLEIFGGPTGLSVEAFESFIELYIAYFNRAPDAIGLNFWGTAFANGTTLQQMATLFIDQDETAATYPPGLSNSDFATAVYTNVLGRVADLEGFNFWVRVLDEGAVTRDQFILSLLEGAKADPPDDATPEFIAQQQADQQFLSNKIDIGAYFAVHKGMSDVANAKAAMGMFNGTPASIDSAVAAIEGFEQSALDPASGEFLMPLVGVLDDPFSGF